MEGCPYSIVIYCGELPGYISLISTLESTSRKHLAVSLHNPHPDRRLPPSQPAAAFRGRPLLCVGSLSGTQKHHGFLTERDRKFAKERKLASSAIPMMFPRATPQTVKNPTTSAAFLAYWSAFSSHCCWG